MRHGLPQLATELAQLTFARVTGVRQTLDGTPCDLSVCPGDPGDPVGHFFGFAVAVDGTTVWFKKATHVSAGGRPGLFLGPVALRPKIAAWRDLPTKGEVVAGHVVASSKGPVYAWWVHGAGPILSFLRAVRRGAVRASATMYRDLALLPDTGRATRVDLWCLARLVISGDMALVASQLRPAARRPHHPDRRNGHTRARGVEITYAPLEFVWHAALLVRCPALLARFTQYLVSHKLWTPDARAAAESGGWTADGLERALRA